MNRIVRSVSLLIATGLLFASFVTFGATTPATAAVTPAWTCLAVPTSTPTPTPTATDTSSPTPTTTPSVPPPAITPMVQIAGDHNEIDETRTLVQVQLKSTAGNCLGGAVVLWEYIGGAWVQYATLTVPDNGSLRLWIAARTTTAWRAYVAPTDSRHAAWSPVFTLYNTPPKPVITTPSWLPHPTLKPAQARALGHGANPVIAPITDALWARMVKASWHPGCPVGRSALRTLSVNYWGFDGFRHRGLLVIAAWAGPDFVGAFNGLYGNSIPLRYLYPVDIFGWSSQTNGGNDYASMRADNSSAFNCRWVDGSPGVMSPHSWGGAVDLNTFENPYESATGWTPTAAWAGVEIKPYAWRHTWDTVVSIMRANRFSWTYGTSDPQHFDAH